VRNRGSDVLFRERLESREPGERRAPVPEVEVGLNEIERNRDGASVIGDVETLTGFSASDKFGSFRWPASSKKEISR
jgi:hypothetical protein